MVSKFEQINVIQIVLAFEPLWPTSLHRQVSLPWGKVKTNLVLCIDKIKKQNGLSKFM